MKNTKLRDLMKEKKVKQSELADLLSISSRSFSLKINRKREFKQSELEKMADFFCVRIDEVMR